MKLIRCHIENFGVLSDFDFAFDDGLTIICQGSPCGCTVWRGKTVFDS